MTQSIDSTPSTSTAPGRRLVRKLPGLGFVYLCTIVCSFALYIYWIYLPGWYNGHLPNEERAAKNAAYIEKIVRDFPADQQQSLRQEQLRFYQQAGDVAAAGRLLSQLDSDSQRQGELLALLSVGEVLSDADIQNVERLLAEELAANAVSTWMDLLSRAAIEFISTRPTSELTARVLEALLTSPKLLPGVVPDAYRLFGVEPDQWVLGRAPGYLLIRTPQSQKLVLTLGVYANEADFPIRVQVSHSGGVSEEVLTSADNVQIELDITANQTELMGITTDKFWSLQSDPRKFAVRLVNVELL